MRVVTSQEIDTILTYIEFVVMKQLSVSNNYDYKALKLINSLRNATPHEFEFLVKLYKKDTY